MRNNEWKSKRVISEDPEYLEVLDEMKLLFKQMRKDFSEEDYDKIAELSALQSLAAGYQHLEYSSQVLSLALK